ncbi:MAG: UDP-glucuronic acid decarboxylase family protein [Armatimonadia bacterium]
MRRVVISGAAGFIGSHLVDHFIQQGEMVYGLDNLCTGRTENVDHLKGESRFALMNYDVAVRVPYFPVPVDLVLHFASPASPLDYAHLPLETLMVGSDGTRNMLELARRHRAKFLVASTSEVYGDPQVHPQKEDYWGHVNPIGVRSQYDEAKRFGEALTMAYHRKLGLDTRIVRIFNTYGPRMRLEDGRCLPAFFKQALSGQPITVFGGGAQTRSFQYVSDLIAGVTALLEADYHGPVNIGNPEEVTVLELAKEIVAVTGSVSKIVAEPLPQDDPMRRCPDISLAKRLLGWEPRVRRAQGLALVLPYFQNEVSRKTLI